MTKRLIILVVTFLVFSVFAGAATAGFIFLFTEPVPPPPPPPPPTWEDLGIFPIQIGWIQHIQKQATTVDIAAQLINPNDEYGTGKFGYSIDLFNSSGRRITTVNGESYILPGQTKYISHPATTVSEFVAEAQISIQEHEELIWQDLVDFVQLNFFVENVNLQTLTDHPRFNTRLVGTVFNNSLFGLQDIKVPALIFNNSGNLIGINNSSIQTVLEGERRDVEYFWEQTFTDVGNIIVEPYSNVFANDNFILRHGGSIPQRESQEVHEPGFRLPEIFDTIRRRRLLIF